MKFVGLFLVLMAVVPILMAQSQTVKTARILKEGKCTIEEIADSLPKSLTVDDMVALKQSGKFSEAEIRVLVEKKGRPNEITKEEESLLRKHFSKEFVEWILGAKKYKITLTVEPPDAGKIVFEPPLPENGIVMAGTRMKAYPASKSWDKDQKYVFDGWGGDWVGNQTMEFVVGSDLAITARFLQVVPPAPPKRVPPQDFADTRKAGYVYSGEVKGCIQGEGEFKNYGIVASTHFAYTYHLKYTSQVLKNNGDWIREKRTFVSVDENLILPPEKMGFRIDLSSEFGVFQKILLQTRWILKVGADALQLAGLDNAAVPIVKAIIKQMDEATENLSKQAKEGEAYVSSISKYHITLDQIVAVLKACEKGTDVVVDFLRWLNIPIPKIPAGASEDVKETILQEFMKKAQLVGYTPQMRILEGKTFLVDYVNGVGITKVDLENQDESFSAMEKRLLERAFMLSDYHIFKDRHNEKRPLHPGDKWEVEANTIAGLLDPRLKHEVEGVLKLTRLGDTDDETSAQFSVGASEIRLVSSPSMSKHDFKKGEILAGKHSGKVAFEKGEILYNLGMRYVTRASLKGKVEYKQLSKDHLLFEARMTAVPTFEILYLCTCEKDEPKQP